MMKSVAKSLALLAVGACATPGFNAKVSRFQQMPAPQGQSFAVVADNPRFQGGLEFANYARLVTDRLARFGYVPAGNPANAALIVHLDYGVDHGQQRIRSTPGYGGFGGGYGGFGRYGYGLGSYGYGYGGWGWPRYGFGQRAYLGGFYDPFLFDDWNSVESYTVYNSQLDLAIEDRMAHRRVFEGKAQALSTDDDLTTLVPNLVEAMFTGFPGNSGETVKITVAPPGRERRYR